VQKVIAFQLLLAITLAQTPTNDLEQAVALLDRLDSTPLVVEYRNEPIERILDDLADRLNIPIRADWQAVARLTIHHDDRVTLKTNPTVATAVLGALALSVGDEFEHPTFEAHAGQLVLTTIAGTAAMRLTGVYDVRDLLANSEVTAHLGPAQPATAPDQQGGNGRPVPTPGEQLYMLITDHVDPDAWINFGGDRATVNDRNGVLMVTATPTTHRRFKQAIDALRRANPSSIAIQSAIVDMAREDFDRLSRRYSPNISALASAISADPKTKILWRSDGAVALDRTLEVKSTDGDVEIGLSLSPRFDQSAGLLRIDVAVGTKHGGDVRSLKTSTATAGDAAGVVLELPAAKTAEMLRLLILIPQRR
jgi:type II secretory pathway component GspD/PulD (secretin)